MSASVERCFLSTLARRVDHWGTLTSHDHTATPPVASAAKCDRGLTAGARISWRHPPRRSPMKRANTPSLVLCELADTRRRRARELLPLLRKGPPRPPARRAPLRAPPRRPARRLPRAQPGGPGPGAARRRRAHRRLDEDPGARRRAHRRADPRPRRARPRRGLAVGGLLRHRPQRLPRRRALGRRAQLARGPRRLLRRRALAGARGHRAAGAPPGRGRPGRPRRVARRPRRLLGPLRPDARPARGAGPRERLLGGARCPRWRTWESSPSSTACGRG